MRETLIYGDWLEGLLIRGQAPKDHGWNGWACPRFAEKQAHEIVTRMNAATLERQANGDEWAVEESGLMFWDGTDLIMWDPMYCGEEYEDGTVEDGITIVQPDADGMYSIGAYGWCWEDVEVHGVPVWWENLEVV